MVAAKACNAAASTLGDNWEVGLISQKRSSRDLVTYWDKKLEEKIINVLTEETPEIPILAEESSKGDSRLNTCWMVDPIDGTLNFSHGLPIWAISIALYYEGTVVVGSVFAPELNWHYEATLGGGATLNGKRISVSKVDSLQSALLATGFPHHREKDDNLKQWTYFQKNAQACRRLGAASLDLCLIASGKFDGYWERQLSPWDLAAGALLINEAGGTVTATDGSRFDPYRGEAVATNGILHQQLIDALDNADRS